MRIALTIAATSTLLAAAAMSDPLPADWSALTDGTLLHAPSAAKCPLRVASLQRAAIESKGASDLGICFYNDESGREGLIRVRQYVRGAGETQLAIMTKPSSSQSPARRMS